MKMYTKIEHQSTNMDSSEILSKDLERKLSLKRNASNDQEIMSPAEEEIMRCLRTSKARMERVGSVDSALGLEGEATEPQQPLTKGRRLTLTITDLPLRPALLPIAEPNNLLDSPTTEANITQLIVPTISSRLLLEENVVEIPEERFVSNSRRQSAQSCLSDYQSSEGGGVRFVRTPSVVVSDYSDDTTTMCGITQEEIDYFRAQRLRRRFSMDTSSIKKDETTSDVSASSSCSNLYYCESKIINPLDKADCYVSKTHTQIENHKIPESSTCQI